MTAEHNDQNQWWPFNVAVLVATLLMLVLMDLHDDRLAVEALVGLLCLLGVGALVLLQLTRPG